MAHKHSWKQTGSHSHSLRTQKSAKRRSWWNPSALAKFPATNNKKGYWKTGTEKDSAHFRACWTKASAGSSVRSFLKGGIGDAKSGQIFQRVHTVQRLKRLIEPELRFKAGCSEWLQLISRKVETMKYSRCGTTGQITVYGARWTRSENFASNKRTIDRFCRLDFHRFFGMLRLLERSCDALTILQEWTGHSNSDAMPANTSKVNMLEKGGNTFISSRTKDICFWVGRDLNSPLCFL